MKKLLFLLSVALAAPAMAQTCSNFVQFNNGTVYTMTTYDAKDKETSSSTTTVSGVVKTATGVKADLTQVVNTDKKKEPTTVTSTVTCDNGTYSIDMKSFTNASMMKTSKDMEIKFEGNNLSYAADLSVGQSLPDGTMKMTSTNQGTPMSESTTTITDRKVVGKESITTSAGTFECYKITYTFSMSTVMFMPTGGTMNMPGMKPRQVTEWFSFKVGPVRSESSKDGKLESYTVLTELKQ